MMRSKLISLIALISMGLSIHAQELNLSVTINTPKLKLADPQVFQSLETTITEFFNNTAWTDDEFDTQERIEGSIQINVKEDISSNSFVADFYVSTSRPIYNSNYYSQTLLLLDRDVNFSYEQFGPIFNNAGSFSDNLSAILTYYAYVILGVDYDSFSPLGGERFFEIAQNIINSVPPNISGSDNSWTAVGSSRNRYWLIENLLNPRVKSYRQAMYDYHRRSLDTMTDDPDRARAIMLSAITAIGEVNRTFPNSMILKLFSDTKRDEIIEVFQVATAGEKTKVYDIMTEIDPALSSEFNSLRTGRK